MEVNKICPSCNKRKLQVIYLLRRFLLVCDCLYIEEVD